MRLRTDGYRPMIEAAYSLLPGSLAQRFASVHFLCGVDPAYVGLWSPGPDDEPLNCDSATTFTSAMTFYPHSQSHLAADRRHPSVWLSEDLLRISEAPLIVVHELGHVLHAVTEWRHSAAPMTEYAETDWCEAFAEAFAIWAAGWEAHEGFYDPAHRSLYQQPDDATRILFEELSA